MPRYLEEWSDGLIIVNSACHSRCWYRTRLPILAAMGLPPIWVVGHGPFDPSADDTDRVDTVGIRTCHFWSCCAMRNPLLPILAIVNCVEHERVEFEKLLSRNFP